MILILLFIPFCYSFYIVILLHCCVCYCHFIDILAFDVIHYYWWYFCVLFLHCLLMLFVLVLHTLSIYWPLTYSLFLWDMWFLTLMLLCIDCCSLKYYSVIVMTVFCVVDYCWWFCSLIHSVGVDILIVVVNALFLLMTIVILLDDVPTFPSDIIYSCLLLTIHFSLMVFWFCGDDALKYSIIDV